MSVLGLGLWLANYVSHLQGYSSPPKKPSFKNTLIGVIGLRQGYPFMFPIVLRVLQGPKKTRAYAIL